MEDYFNKDDPFIATLLVKKSPDLMLATLDTSIQKEQDEFETKKGNQLVESDYVIEEEDETILDTARGPKSVIYEELWPPSCQSFQ